MAIKEYDKKENIDNQIIQLREIIIQMNKLNEITSDFSDINVRQSKKLGTKFEKLLASLLKSECGVSRLVEMLDDTNPTVQFIIARNLYPMFPARTMKIMKNYQKHTNDKLEKMRVQDVVRGFETKQNVFIQQFKRLYNCDNLDSLNREKNSVKKSKKQNCIVIK